MTSSGALTIQSYSVENIGGSVGYLVNSSMTNASASGNVSINTAGYAGYIGGLVGNSNPSSAYTISGSSYSGILNVVDTSYVENVGGLVGRATRTTIINSSVQGEVNVETTDLSAGAFVGAIGGLVGGLDTSALVTDSYSDNDVTIESYHVGSAGGLVGLSSGTINGSGMAGLAMGRGTLTVTSYDPSLTSLSTANGIGGLVGVLNGSLSNATSSVDVNIENSATTGTVFFVGGLVGSNNTGSISNSSSDAILTIAATRLVSSVGGLVGINNNPLSSSFSTGAVNVTTTDYASEIGGFVGYNIGEAVSNSYSSGAVNVVSDGASGIGGFIGTNEGASADLSSSYTSGDVTVSGPSSVHWIGGLVGLNDMADIINSYSDNDLLVDTDASSWYIGGLVGGHYDGTISGAGMAGAAMTRGTVTVNTDATIPGSNDNFGGLVGFNNNGNISNVISGASVSSNNGQYIGGLVGHNWSTSVTTGIISNATATGNVTVNSANQVNSIGGLVGRNESNGGSWTTISTSNFSGDVSVTSSTVEDEGILHVGGVVGHNIDATLDGVSTDNTASVTTSWTEEWGWGAKNFGGVVGFNDAGSVINSTSRTDIIATGGSHIGGLVGLNVDGTLTNNTVTSDVSIFLDSTLTSQDSGDMGMLVGYHGNTTYGVNNLTGNIVQAVDITAYGDQALIMNVGGYIGANGGDDSLWDLFLEASSINGINLSGSMTVNGTDNYDVEVVGGIFGNIYSSSSFGGVSFDNLNSSVTINSARGYDIGGIAGLVYGTTLTNATSTSTINISGSTNYYVGGVIGGSWGTNTFSQVNSDAVINILEGSAYQFGGVAGILSGVDVSDSTSSATINAGNAQFLRNIGGFTGNWHEGGGSSLTNLTIDGVTLNLGSLANRVQGNVTSVGGFAGESLRLTGGMQNISISNTFVNIFSTGTVTNVGGVIGGNGYTVTTTDVGAIGSDTTNVVADTDIVINSLTTDTNAVRFVGGIIGLSRDAVMNNNVFSGTISITAAGGVRYIGGLMGDMEDQTYGSSGSDVNPEILNSSYSGSLQVSTTGDVNNIGGALGGMRGHTLTWSAEGNVTGVTTSGDITVNGANVTSVGGLVGSLLGTNTGGKGVINTSSAAGTLSVTATGQILNVGGLVGLLSTNYRGSTRISNSAADAVISVTSTTATGTIDHVGGLVGRNNDAAIDGSGLGATTMASGTITVRSSNTSTIATGVEFVGGLIGYNQNGNLTSTSSDVDLDLNHGKYIGGLVGQNIQQTGYSGYGTITGSHASGNILATNTGLVSYVGGLVGVNDNANIQSSWAVGGIQINSATSNYVGGLVGLATKAAGILGSISTSYATGTITITGQSGQASAISSVGGLIGSYSGNGAITDSYANNSVNITLNDDGTTSSSDITDIGGFMGSSLGGGANINISGSYTGGASQVNVTNLDAGSGSQVYRVGGFIGRADDTNINGSGITAITAGAVNVSSLATGNTKIYSVGGLVGEFENLGFVTGGIISGANSTASVTTNGGQYIGGLVGALYSQLQEVGKIVNSSATGNVSVTTAYGTDSIGGLVGLNQSASTGNTTILDSFSNNVVRVTNASNFNTQMIGGLVGQNLNAQIDGAGMSGAALARGSVVIETLATTDGRVANIGGLVGMNSSGSVRYAISSAALTIGYDANGNGIQEAGDYLGAANNVGGLVGYNYSTSTVATNGKIANSSATGNVTVNSSNAVNTIGGLVGYNYSTVTANTTITSSGSAGNVSVTSSLATAAGSQNAGGAIGYNQTANISAVSASGLVTISVNAGVGYGGLVGNNSGAVTNSFFTGNLTATQQGTSSFPTFGSIGGLIGTSSGSVSGSYTSADVTVNGNSTTGTAAVSHIGGLIGNSSAAITNSYTTNTSSVAVSVTGSTTTLNYVGGLVGQSGSTIDGSGMAGIAMSQGSVIVNTANTNSVFTQYIGGLVGYLTGGLSNAISSSTVSVNYGRYIGGAVGRSLNATISGVTGSGAITLTNSGTYVGGVIGYLDHGIVTGSSFNGAINTRANASGGIAGINYGGTITGNTFSGGITSTVTNDRIGGIVGNNSADSAATGGEVTNNTVTSAATITVSGSGQISEIGGIIGTNNAPGTGTAYNNNISGNTMSGNISINSTYASTSAIDGIGGIIGESYRGALSGNVVNTTTSITIQAVGSNNIGGLIGRFYGGANSTIENSKSGATINITSSSATGVANAVHSVGGLIGGTSVSDGTRNAISNSSSTGMISIDMASDTAQYIGGLIGSNIATNIATSFSMSIINTERSLFVGGLVGQNINSNIANSFYNASITDVYTGTVNLGGLVGGHFASSVGDAVISNSYASNTVSSSGSSKGGLIGTTTLSGYVAGTTTNSFWDSTVSALGTSSGGTAKTTAQMKAMATFTAAGWSIRNTGTNGGEIWRIYEGSSYPLLAWNLIAVTVTANNDSKAYDAVAYTGGNDVSYSLGSMDMTKILGTVSYSGNSQGAVNVGTYNITPGGLFSAPNGYDISYANGLLTVY